VELEEVTTDQCTVIAAMGLTQRDIEREAAEQGTMAYLRAGVHTPFERDARFVIAALADLKALGASVLASPILGYAPVNLDTVREAARYARVLVFLAHHLDGRVQLGPHMFPVDEVAAAIGPEFDGVVDLGACDSEALVTAAVRAGSRANWIGCAGANRLDVRTAIVRATQRVLFAQPGPYLDVFTAVLEQFSLQIQELV
jgi:hypothetical protein